MRSLPPNQKQMIGRNPAPHNMQSNPTGPQSTDLRIRYINPLK